MLTKLTESFAYRVLPMVHLRPGNAVPLAAPARQGRLVASAAAVLRRVVVPLRAKGLLEKACGTKLGEARQAIFGPTSVVTSATPCEAIAASI